MSGYKQTYVSVTTQEYNRMRRLAAEATTSSAAVRDVMDVVQRMDQRSAGHFQEIQHQIDGTVSSLRTVDTRISSLGSAVASNSAAAQALRGQLRDAVQNSNRALNGLAHNMQGEIDQTRSDFSSAMRDMGNSMNQTVEASEQRLERSIAASNRSLTSGINAVREQTNQLHRTLDTVQQSVDSITHGNAELLEQAREYQAVTRELNADTAKYPADRLGLGQESTAAAQSFQTAESDTALAARNPANASVARQEARIAFEAALTLHNRIISENIAWQRQYASVLHTYEVVSSRLEANRRVDVPETDEDGKPCTLSVDVDHWSNGGLTEQRRILDAISARLESKPDRSGLDAILSELRAVMGEISGCIFSSVLTLHASQDRADLAEDFAQSLGARMGLQVCADAYQGGDQRGAFRVILRNPTTGFELAVTQTPCVRPGEAAPANNVEVQVNNYGRETFDTHTANNIIQAANDALHGAGYTASLAARGEPAAPAAVDDSWVSAARPQTVLQPEQLREARTQAEPFQQAQTAASK